MRKCVVAVQGPMQLLAGMLALQWYGEVRHGSPDAEAVLVLFEFGAAPSDEGALAEAILQLAGAGSWNKVLFLDAGQMRDITRRRVGESVRALRERLGCEACDELYVMRDFGFMGNQLLINAYPGATRITYGDSLGIVGDEEVFRLTLDRWLAQPLGTLKLALRHLVLGRPRRYPFHAAVLALPQDWTGKYLEQVPLMVPSRECVVELVLGLAGQVPELHAYCDSLFPGAGERGTLYLLSNLANSGLCTFEDEVALYEEVVRETAAKGGRVLLRNHPRAGSAVTDQLTARLSGEYQVVLVDDTRFSKLPIELWSSLIRRCDVVPVYSASAIHIRYLYGQRVLVPLDDDRIERYFHSNKRAFMRKGNEMICRAMSGLDGWDGKSPLWKGN